MVAAGHLDQQLPRALRDVGVGGVLDDRRERAVDVEQHCAVLWILLQRGERIGQGRGRHVTSMAGMSESKQGDGYAVSSLDAMGEGYGFRKIRRELGVTAFGINALVLPAGYEAGTHYHEQQEETYFVHQGEVEFRFGDDSTHRLGPAAWHGWTPARTAACATSARPTRSWLWPAARTDTSGATGRP